MRQRLVRVTITLITDATVQELKDDYRQTAYPSDDVIKGVHVEILEENQK